MRGATSCSAKLRSGEVAPLALIAGRLDEWEADIAGWRLEQLLAVIPGCRLGDAARAIGGVRGQPPDEGVRALTYERREQLARLVADALSRPRPG